MRAISSGEFARRAAATLAGTLVLVCALAASQAAAATFTVTGTLDSSPGGCVGTVCPSLRAAISAANTATGPDQINLGTGVFRIELPSTTPEDSNASGDLDVTGDLTIKGAGAQATTILGALPAGKGERDIDVPDNASLTLEGLTVSGGREGENAAFALGGGIASRGNGTLDLERVVVSNNLAEGKASFGNGGGVYKSGGLLTIGDSAILSNRGINPGAGGGVFSEGATAKLTNVIVAGNSTNFVSGGLQLEGPATLDFVTVFANSTRLEGGGVIFGSENAHVRGSIISGNESTETAADDCTLAAISEGGNVVGPSCGFSQPTDFTTSNPMLGSLEGSPIPYLEPLAGSPALDRAAAPCPATDIRGVARPQGGACDSGAVERVVAAAPSPPPSGSTPATTQGATTTAPSAPVLTDASQSNAVWRAGGKLASLSKRVPVGTVFGFSLDRAASVTFRFAQIVPGRRVRGRCVVPSGSNRRKPACKRAQPRGSFTVRGHAGADKVSFQGRLSPSSKLPPGAYSVQIVASNSAGRSQARTLRFAIVR